MISGESEPGVELSRLRRGCDCAETGIERRPRNIFLVLKVSVDRYLAHIGEPGNVASARAVVSLSRKQSDGSANDPCWDV